MRIAVLGGTGTFGRALAVRFHDLGHEVAIGSRDETRAREQAAVIGVEGGANADVAASADYVVLATASGAAIDTARELREAIGRTPVLCVASDLRFTKEGVLPARSQGSVASTRTCSSAATIRRRRSPHSRSARSSSSGTRSTPARSPTPAPSKA